MSQDLLVESHLGASPREAARRLGRRLARRLAPHRPTVLWQLAVRGELPRAEVPDGLAEAITVDKTVGGHGGGAWTSAEIGDAVWRVPQSAVGANVIIVLGGEGALGLRLGPLHDLATPAAPLSDLRRLVASAALVFEHGPHGFCVPGLEHGTNLEVVDGYLTSLAESPEVVIPRGLRVLGTPRHPGHPGHPDGVAPRAAGGLPFIEPLYRS